ncbi:MAG: rhomboid family intramembrane serine protease [Candidatus Woesearchaeota archaeon]
MSLAGLLKDAKIVFRSTSISDFLVLSALPLVMFCLMFVPARISDLLKLNLNSPKWWQFFTNSFFHAGWKHFLFNALMYFLIVIPSFLFSAYSGKKHIYYKMYAAACGAYPIASLLVGSISSQFYFKIMFPKTYLMNAHQVSGSSGIVASLMGILPFVFLSRYHAEVSFKNKMFFLSLLYCVAIFILIYGSVSYKVLSIVAFLIVLIMLLSSTAYLKIFLKSIRKDLRANRFLGFLSLLLPLFFIGAPFALFPNLNKLASEGMLVNFGGHYFGLILGILAGSIVFETM